MVYSLVNVTLRSKSRAHRMSNMSNSTPETISIRLTARTDRLGSTATKVVEIDREDWESMDSRERDECMLDELWNSGLIEWSYDEVGK